MRQVARASLFFGFFLALAGALQACGGGAMRAPAHPLAASRPGAAAHQDVEQFLAFYNPILVGLYTESAQTAWDAATDVSEVHTGQRTGAQRAFSAFAGSADVISRAQRLLRAGAELDEVQRRQLRAMLELAADAPMTQPEVARARVAAESAQKARLDGYIFCLERSGEGCRAPLTANDIDRVLVESRELPARKRVWEASKAVGNTLRPGLFALRGLRNRVAQAMGYRDFFAFQVSNYEMSTEEMVALLDTLLMQMMPLYRELHCWARHRLADRYGVDTPPPLIPAHWLGNRWGQSWPGLVEGVNMDALVESKTPQWLVRTAERFYVSLGFPALPASFWSKSDLYPVPSGDPRKKNAHASAWHIDLGRDVRSLMSVENTWRWFTTAHHELGHIYYYITYTRPEVPPLLRQGANRSYHEGIGDLLALAASQPPYLRELGLLGEDASIDQSDWLLEQALTGPVVFLPFAAGVMSHFEAELYAEAMPEARVNERWWALVAEYQGIAPPAQRPAAACDACTKTHINDDPAQYYDYALANVLVYQLHEHICTRILHQDPHACSYAGRAEVGAFLSRVMEVGATRDWRAHLAEHLGEGLSAEPMLRYYQPLLAELAEQNRGRSCTFGR